MTCHKLMAIWGVQGQRQLLEVTVVGCYNLEDKESVAVEYLCVVLEYGGSMKRTKTCSGKHPTFEEKVVFAVVDGVEELKIAVLTRQPHDNDGIIGCVRIQLQQVLSDGYVDSTWNLQRTDGRHAGDIRLVLQLPNSTQHNTSYTMPTLAPATPPMQPNAIRQAILSQLLPYGSSPLAPPVPPPTSPAYDIPHLCTTYPPNSASTPPSLYPPTQPMQPNATHPAVLSQLLPYGSSTPAPALIRPTVPTYCVQYPCSTYPPSSAPTTPSLYPPTQPISCYPSTLPPAGYYHPHPYSRHHQHATYSPPPTGPSSAIYPPPQH